MRSRSWMVACVVATNLVGMAAACSDPESSPSPTADGAAPGPDGSVAPNDASGAADVPTVPATWSARASLPQPQQETAVVAIANKIYVIGGFLDDTQPTTTVRVYEPSTDAWSTAAPLPEPLHHVNAAVVDDRIWIVGALRSLSFAAAGVVIVYDPIANVWTPKPAAAMPAGSERGSSVVGAIGKIIYVAGGIRGGAVADFSSFDTTNETWTPLPPMDAPRDHGMSAVVDGRLYAIGGRGTGIGAHTARVDMFDPGTKAWTARAAMPTSRGGGAAAVAKGLVVVAGGEGNPKVASGIFAEVEAYDPKSNAWSSMPAMRTPRHGNGAATVNDVVYVPGGGDKQGFGATAVVEALTF